MGAFVKAAERNKPHPGPGAEEGLATRLEEPGVNEAGPAKAGSKGFMMTSGDDSSGLGPGEFSEGVLNQDRGRFGCALQRQTHAVARERWDHSKMIADGDCSGSRGGKSKGKGGYAAKAGRVHRAGFEEVGQIAEVTCFEVGAEICLPASGCHRTPPKESADIRSSILHCREADVSLMSKMNLQAMGKIQACVVGLESDPRGRPGSAAMGKDHPLHTELLSGHSTLRNEFSAGIGKSPREGGIQMKSGYAQNSARKRKGA